MATSVVGLKKSIHGSDSLKHASDDCGSNDMERVVMHRCSVVVIVGQDKIGIQYPTSLSANRDILDTSMTKEMLRSTAALTFSFFPAEYPSINPSNNSNHLPKHRHNRSPPHTNTPRHGPKARRNRRRAIMVAARRMLAHVLGSRYGRRQVAVRRV